VAGEAGRVGAALLKLVIDHLQDTAEISVH
jgi:hypothetical protein